MSVILNAITTINIIDVFLIVFLSFGAFRGYRKGLISIVFDALALFSSYYIARYYAPPVTSWMKHVLHFNFAWSSVVAMCLVYFVSFASLKLAGIGITKLFSNSFVGVTNRVVGMVLNSLKWLVVSMAVLAILLHIPKVPFREYAGKSGIYSLYQKHLSKFLI
jgi:membrane protein required for colicin V production